MKTEAYTIYNVYASFNETMHLRVRLLLSVYSSKRIKLITTEKLLSRAAEGTGPMMPGNHTKYKVLIPAVTRKMRSNKNFSFRREVFYTFFYKKER